MSIDEAIKKLNKEIEIERLRNKEMIDRAEKPFVNKEKERNKIKCNMPWLSISTSVISLFFQPLGYIYNLIWIFAYLMLKKDNIYKISDIKLAIKIHIWLIIIPAAILITSIAVASYYGIPINYQFQKIFEEFNKNIPKNFLKKFLQGGLDF